MTRLTIWLRKEKVFEGPQVFSRSTAAILSLQFAPQLLEEQRPERVENHLNNSTQIPSNLFSTRFIELETFRADLGKGVSRAAPT